MPNITEFGRLVLDDPQKAKQEFIRVGRACGWVGAKWKAALNLKQARFSAFRTMFLDRFEVNFTDRESRRTWQAFQDGKIPEATVLYYDYKSDQTYQITVKRTC